MSAHYTDADVQAAARAQCGSWHGMHAPCPSCAHHARTVLDVVAPAIAARALREAADALLPPYDCELRHDGSEDPEMARWVGYCAETDDFLRKRADEIERATT